MFPGTLQYVRCKIQKAIKNLEGGKRERIPSVSWQIPSPLRLYHPKRKMGIIILAEALGLFKYL